MKKINRKNFIKTAAISTAAVSAGIFTGCSTEKHNKSAVVISNKHYEWKMVTTWPPHFPILGEYADKFAEWVDTMSQGRLKIHVYGGNELVPPLETLDAVSSGVAEIGHGAAYYWAGKAPAAQFFGSVPFGMNAVQVNAWFEFGDVLDMWKELYTNFNVIPFPCGNTGGQMGGWFNKKINSISDIKGLKIRIPGLGGKVITKAGGSAVLSPAGELYTDLERGIIDALEWIGPYHDYLMGFNKIAKYYYYPGWHEPGSVLELIINKNAFEKLPDDLKQIIKAAVGRANILMLAEFEAKNTEYYYKILNEGKIKFLQFPKDVLSTFKKLNEEVLDEITSNDAMSKKVYTSYKKFQNDISKWYEIAERNYV